MACPSDDDVMEPFHMYEDLRVVNDTFGKRPLQVMRESKYTLTEKYHHTTKRNVDAMQSACRPNSICAACCSLDITPFLVTSEHASGYNRTRLQRAWTMICPAVSAMAHQYSSAIEFVAGMNDLLYTMGKYDKTAGDLFRFLADVEAKKISPKLNCVAGVVFSLLANALLRRTPLNAEDILDPGVTPVVAAETDRHVFLVILRDMKTLASLRETPWICPAAENIVGIYESTMGIPYSSKTWAWAHPTLDVTKYVMHWVLDVDCAQTTHFCATASECHSNRGTTCHSKKIFPVACDKTNDPLYHTQHLRSMHRKTDPSLVVRHLQMLMDSIHPGMQLTYSNVLEFLCNRATELPHCRHRAVMIGKILEKVQFMRKHSPSGWTQSKLAGAIRKLEPIRRSKK